MKLRRCVQNNLVLCGGLGIGLLLYVVKIFSALPFLQHEMVGQAFWWTQSPEPLLNLLFDSVRMDCHPGRFRYVEYLLQAVYWKFTALGIIPRNFYDYFAILAVLLSAVLLSRIAKRRQLRHWEIFLILAVFLGSTHSHLIALFNFRKAKYVTTFYFLFLIWVSERWTESGRTKEKPLHLPLLWGSFGILGCFTDPFFVLMSPLVVLALDINQRENKFRNFGALCFSLFVGAGLVLIVNNVIGVRYSENARVSLNSIPGRPEPFLNLRNLPGFYKLIADILLPHHFDSLVPWIGGGLTLGLAFLVVLAFKKQWKPKGFLLAFFLSLIVGTFAIAPIRENAYFTGYYGYPILMFFVLALLEVFTFCRRYHFVKARMMVAGVALTVLGFHLNSHARTLEHWSFMYAGSPVLYQKVMLDYALILDIQEKLIEHPDKPYVLALDHWKVRHIVPSLGVYFDQRGFTDHTDLAYLFVPSVFRREMEEGRLKIVQKLPVNLPACRKESSAPTPSLQGTEHKTSLRDEGSTSLRGTERPPSLRGRRPRQSR